MTTMTMVVDLDRCIGCYGCEIACKMEHDVPLGNYWNKVLPMGPYGEFPHVDMFFFTAACQHCENPACVEVCPTGASIQQEDGVVLIDSELCIGCMSCMTACPYDARSLNPKTNVVEKCTLCAELREEGDRPACAKCCTGNARLVGDADDPESDVAKALAEAGEENVYTLTDSGTGPSVKFILHENISAWVEPDLTGWSMFA